MPDYNLYGLSPRSFEQLVQALSAKIFGPNLVVFGDGPDGGREAIFEGLTQYPSADAPWNGYVVLQAKFRQRQQTVEMDGAWAVTQLAKELKKFSTKKRGLRKPEYYVFCTNVVLTPAEKVGGKDRTRQMLTEFSKKYGLNDFAIWDYDQIRTFLDVFPEVRQTYAAWVTPGDVLTEVIRNLTWSRPAFDVVMSNFLQKELLADQYVNLEQAGHAADEKTPMARVFIDLPAIAQQTSDPPAESDAEKRPGCPPGFMADLLMAGAQRLSTDPAVGAARETQDEPLPGRFVIVGGPGQGKTTLSQFACQLHRAAILASRPPGTLSGEVRSALAEIQRHCENDGLPLPNCRRFPIRITLNQFANELSSRKHGTSILSHITDRIKHRTQQEITYSDMRQWLRAYPWLVIFDGLDEVPPSSNRDDVLRAIQDFWVDATECNSDLLVLATTRPQGYEQDFSPRFYTHRYLAPLSQRRAMHYGSRLAAVRYGNDKDREQRIIERLERAVAEDATARLMRSPLQVTIMATLVDQTGQPPRERWRLFHEYYEVIYRREMERDIPAATILREHKANIDVIHHTVGLTLQVESERAGLTDPRLTAAGFGRIVAARLATEGYEGRALTGLQQQIVDAAVHRLVFLVGMKANQVGFEIRSLQEFMAAEALMDGTDELVSQRLDIIAPVSHWQNVFLFAAGKCFSVRQHLRDTILRICATLNDAADDDLSRLTLTGSLLAVEVLSNGGVNQQPKFERSLARIGLRLADLPGIASARVSSAYHASLDEVFRDEIRRRLSMPSMADKSGAWLVLLALVARDVRWATELACAQWPDSEHERSELFNALECIPTFALISSNPLMSPWLESRLFEARVTESMLDAFRRSVYWSLGTELAPEWWAALTRISGSKYSQRNSPFSAFGLRVAITRVADAGRTEDWKTLSSVPATGKGWHALRKASEFAVRPGAESLAAAIGEVARESDSVDVGQLAAMSPWPLAEALLFCHDRQDAQVVAESAGRGELGDVQTWLRAEDRWARGIGVNDALASDAHGALPGRYIADAGFCFLSASIERFQKGRGEIVREIITQMRDLSSRRLRFAIADLLETILTVPSHDYSRVDCPDVVNVDEIWTNPEGHLSLDVAALLNRGGECTAALVNSLETAGRKRNVYAGSQSVTDGFYNSLCRAWVEDPRREGLLPVLVQWARHIERCGLIVDSLRNWKGSEPRFEVARLLLLFMHSDSDVSQAKWIAAQVVEHLQQSTYLAHVAVMATLHKGIRHEAAVSFLQSIYGLLPKSALATRSIVMGGLDSLARRRSSNLDDLAVQKVLNVEVVSQGEIEGNPGL